MQPRAEALSPVPTFFPLQRPSAGDLAADVVQDSAAEVAQVRVEQRINIKRQRLYLLSALGS